MNTPPNNIPCITPAARMADAAAYAPGGRRGHVDLLLDANEGAAPSVELLDALGRIGPEVLRRYPNARPLEATIAARFGLAPDQVIVTAGADDGLYRACMAVLEPGREIILPSPTFEMFPRYARLAGGRIVSIPWVEPRFPIDAVLAAITPATAMVVVVSPNNPTGTVAQADDLRRIAATAPHALVVVDLAYGEFAEIDLTPMALTLPNAVVFRSFSKAWGLAGLRVGYAMGPPAIIAWLRATGNPFSVSSPSVAIVAERLAQTSKRRNVETSKQENGWGDDLTGFIAQVRRERAELERRLAGHGVRTWPAQGNFVLAKLRDALWFRDALSGLGIGVRAFPDRSEIADCVRITCPCDDAKFARLCHGVDTALAPQALMVDGVLATAEGEARVSQGCLVLRNKLPKRPEIELFMKVLGLGRAWLATSTPGTVVEARTAGVVPVGVARPGADRDSIAEALFDAGAARVVTRIEDVQELMP